MARKKKHTILQGQAFGLWTVVTKQDEAMVECRCECGTQKLVGRNNLTRGLSASCGCLGKERFNGIVTKHGLSKTRAYRSWKAMKARCYRQTHSDYPRYGGRGIQVCARWKDDFAAFFADLGERPAGSSLDRKDVDGDYCPDNCHWTTQKQQMRNTRRTTSVTINGETKSVAQWAEESGVPLSTLYKRVYAGWSEDRLLSPVRPMKRAA